MASKDANGIRLEYESIGEAGAPPVLLIMGLGCQLITWPEEFCEGLRGRGLRLIRFDNRDAGMSGKCEGLQHTSLSRSLFAHLLGRAFKPAYTLEDMADDSVALLDALEIESAHVVGASMGGMIGQIMAIRHGHRLRSLTSIMSTTGNPDLPQASLKVRLMMARPRPGTHTPESAKEYSYRLWRTIGSPEYPVEEARLRELIERGYQRSYYPSGVARQLLAVMAAPCRVDVLRQLEIPTLVIHGNDDPLVPVAAGKDTAEAIPGARLKIYPGMGHDFPVELLGEMAGLIAEHIEQVEQDSTPLRSLAI